MQKKALVTGASEGIGRAIVKKLASENYTITIVARNSARLEQLHKELPHSIHKIITADLCKKEDVLNLAKLFSEEHYDLLVNNAGAGVYGKFSELPLEKILTIFQLNCESLLVLSHAFLQNAKKGDALVNVSSTVAFLTLPGSATYSGTKSFVTALSEAIWYEQKKRDVYVMNLCPGLTKTEFSNRAGGRKVQPPESMYQSSEEVAEEMFQALRKRCKPTVVTGMKNRFMVFLTRFLSRKKAVNIMGSIP